MKMNIYNILLMFLLSCSNKHEENSQNINATLQIEDYQNFDTINVEKNFEIKSINEFKKPIGNNNLIPYEIISNIFLYPINNTIYGKSFIASKYYVGYRYKLSEKVWILSYKHHYDLHGEETIWNIYNSETKQLLSKISIYSIDSDFYRNLEDFDGKHLLIKTIYRRHFKNGMEGDNSQPIEMLENYEIDKGFKFKKIQ